MSLSQLTGSGNFLLTKENHVSTENTEVKKIFKGLKETTKVYVQPEKWMKICLKIISNYFKKNIILEYYIFILGYYIIILDT